jgi:hypothetical protein
MAVFGLPGSRQRAYRELTSADNLLGSLGIEEIYDIGPDCNVPSTLGAIPVKRLGAQAPQHLADLFSRLRFGFVPHAPKYLAKSSIFASYCAQGVIPLVNDPFSEEVNGLRDGVHVVSPQTAQSAQSSGLESCSRAAWNWYSAHRLRVHAEFYARWIEEQDAIEASLTTASANMDVSSR